MYDRFALNIANTSFVLRCIAYCVWLASVAPAVVIQTLAIVRSLGDGDELQLGLFGKGFNVLTDKLPELQRKTAFRYRDELRKSIIAQFE